MPSNDHIVPQMYLRRFAQKRKKGHFISAFPVGALDGSATFMANVKSVATRSGYNIGVTDDGEPHHDAERLFSVIESAASRGFKAMLDDSEYALPRRWPMNPLDRQRMSWWLAAQILRTNRQRRRLIGLSDQALDAPSTVRSYLGNNLHLKYIAKMLGSVAAVVHHRPWCLAFSDACLLTSDVPVLVLNGQDDPDQALSVAFWDVVVPLDPHRFLLLPGHGSVDDPRKSMDHLAKFDGGLGIFINQAVHDAADQHVFLHPDHPNALSLIESGGRLHPPDTDAELPQPQYVLSYSPMPPGYTVERRWLSAHSPPS